MFPAHGNLGQNDVDQNKPKLPLNYEMPLESSFLKNPPHIILEKIHP